MRVVNAGISLPRCLWIHPSNNLINRHCGNPPPRRAYHLLGGIIVINRASGGNASSQCDEYPGGGFQAQDHQYPAKLKAMDSIRISGKEAVR